MKCLLVTFLLLVSARLVCAQVTEQWVARYDGPFSGADRATAMALDAAGNVYVTGFSQGVSEQLNYATVKYDPDGNELWAARYTAGGSGGDRATAMAVDTAGNVFVTGLSASDGTGFDYATVKYDTDGNELWVARYDGPASGPDAAYAIALDADGNVYVTGESKGLDTSSDYATVKYDTDGNELWVARYNGPDNGYDFANAIAVDGTGNVYVAGESQGVVSVWDYATVKYDTDGNELWVARYNGPGEGHDAARAIAVDAANSVYVTGSSVDEVRTHPDYATVKYDTDGNELWVARYNGPANGGGSATAIAIDAAGNVHVTGYSTDGVTQQSAYGTVKYDLEGNELWVARYDGPGTFRDGARAMALDAAGNVYVTGESWSREGRIDYATLAYDSDGNQQWAARYASPDSGPSIANAIAVDAAGNVYVTGYSWGGLDVSDDYATIKYSQK